MKFYVSQQQYSVDVLREHFVAPVGALLTEAMESQAHVMQKMLEENADVVIKYPGSNMLYFSKPILYEPTRSGSKTYKRPMRREERETEKFIQQIGGQVTMDGQAKFKYYLGTVPYDDGNGRKHVMTIQNIGPNGRPCFRVGFVVDNENEFPTTGGKQRKKRTIFASSDEEDVDMEDSRPVASGGRALGGAAGGARKRASSGPLPDYTFHPDDFIEVKKVTVDNVLLVCAQADITKVWATAIVNAANESLSHGAGVAKAISDAAGPIVKEESKDWIRMHGKLLTGKAVAVTRAGKLSDHGTEYVIHVAGPQGVFEGWRELLYDAVMLALKTAEDRHCESVALPAISSGIFGCPVDKCAAVITQCGVDFAKTKPLAVRRILFVNIDKPTTKAMSNALMNVRI